MQQCHRVLLKKRNTASQTMVLQLNKTLKNKIIGNYVSFKMLLYKIKCAILIINYINNENPIFVSSYKYILNVQF